jgi:hypothetical protein
MVGAARLRAQVARGEITTVRVSCALGYLACRLAGLPHWLLLPVRPLTGRELAQGIGMTDPMPTLIVELAILAGVDFMCVALARACGLS